MTRKSARNMTIISQYPPPTVVVGYIPLSPEKVRWQKVFRFRWSFLSATCPGLQLIHFHLRISSLLIPILLMSFTDGFQQPSICSDSAESRGGDREELSRRGPPPAAHRAGWWGEGQTLSARDTLTPHLFLLFYAKEAKRQPLRKPLSVLITSVKMPPTF